MPLAPVLRVLPSSFETTSEGMFLLIGSWDVCKLDVLPPVIRLTREVLRVCSIRDAMFLSCPQMVYREH